MTTKPNFAVLVVSLAMVVGIYGCGGKKAVESRVPALDRDQRRVAVMDGNDLEIRDAVRDVVSSGTDSNRVHHAWNGHNLSMTISGANPSDTVSLSSATNSAHDFEATDSPVRGSNFSRREFDIGKTSSGRHTIGRFGVDWNENDVSDHLAYGYWLTANSFDNVPSVVDAGVFVNGPEFDTSANLPASGTARYNGRAAGLHTVKYRANEFKPTTDQFSIAEFRGDVFLTAFFDDPMLIAGSIDNIYYTTNEESVVDGSLHESGFSRERPFQILLYDASLARDGSFSSEIVRVINTNPKGKRIVDSTGSWQGKMSSVSVSQDDPSPRLAAGTFGTEFYFPAGTVGQYIGSFIAEKN